MSQIDPDIAESRTPALLAAVLHLLSRSAVRGPSRARTDALIQHLTALAARKETDPLLAGACEELAQVWQRLALAEVAAPPPVQRLH